MQFHAIPFRSWAIVVELQGSNALDYTDCFSNINDLPKRLLLPYLLEQIWLWRMVGGLLIIFQTPTQTHSFPMVLVDSCWLFVTFHFYLFYLLLVVCHIALLFIRRQPWYFPRGCWLFDGCCRRIIRHIFGGILCQVVRLWWCLGVHHGALLIMSE